MMVVFIGNSYAVYHLVSFRADVEEKYGRSLIRIAESAKGKEEIG